LFLLPTTILRLPSSSNPTDVDAVIHVVVVVVDVVVDVLGDRKASVYISIDIYIFGVFVFLRASVTELHNISRFLERLGREGGGGGSSGSSDSLVPLVPLVPLVLSDRLASQPDQNLRGGGQMVCEYELRADDWSRTGSHVTSHRKPASLP